MTKVPRVGKDVEHLEFSYVAERNAKWYNTLAVFTKAGHMHIHYAL